MDIFGSSYYRINKFLLSSLGEWPFQRLFQKRVNRTLYCLATVTIVIPEIIQLFNVSDNLDNVIECANIIGIQLATNIKVCNYILNQDKIKLILRRIDNHWKTEIFGPQMKILKNYTNEGKKLTEIYTVYMYSTLALYLILPLMPKILDVVMPLNETRPVIYLLPAKYGNLNSDEYYLPILIHANIAAIYTITTIVAMDTTYAFYVQHVCGMFAALGDQLKISLEYNDDDGGDVELQGLMNFKRQKEEAAYRAVVNCVKMHKEAIEFAKDIESGHATMLLFVVGLSVFCMSVAGYQTVMSFDKPHEAIRFATFTIAQVAHIFFISWPGQKLIDHSERMYEWVYGGKWYEASARSKKLVIIMMLRSFEPCKLTAGKLYVMSLANFSMVVRSAVSYFTVLTSFR